MESAIYQHLYSASAAALGDDDSGDAATGFNYTNIVNSTANNLIFPNPPFSPEFIKWYHESLRKDAEFRRQMAECFHEDTSQNRSITVEDEALKQMKAISYGVVLTVICSFGIVGNLLNLIVLTRQRFKAIMYIYLRWMAFADLNAAFFVIIYIIRNGWGVLMTNVTAAYYYAHFAVPIINMFLVTSSIMVVIVTVERYLSTCHPIKSRQLVTPFRAKMTAAFAYVLSFFLYIPMAFEFRVSELESVVMDEKTGFAVPNATALVYTPCYHKEYADSHVYASVYKTIQATITKFIPILTITVLNTLTLVEFRKIIKRHHSLTNRTRKEKKQFDEEYRLTVMLICVVLVYIVCLVPNTLAWLFRTSDKQKEFSFQVFIIIADLLEVMNSSLNFYMYCMASADFRKHFRGTFCPRLARSAAAGSRYVSDMRSEADTCAVVNNTSMTRCPSSAPEFTNGNGSTTALNTVATDAYGDIQRPVTATAAALVAANGSNGQPPGPGRRRGHEYISLDERNQEERTRLLDTTADSSDTAAGGGCNSPDSGRTPTGTEVEPESAASAESADSAGGGRDIVLSNHVTA